MTQPPDDGRDELAELRAENARVREQILRMLRVEADLFRRNELLDAQSTIYRALSELGRRFNGGLGAREIAGALVHFALYSLNLERGAVVLHDGDLARVQASDGYYDASADELAALVFARGEALFDGVAPGDPRRLRSLPVTSQERDEVGRAFHLDEYALLPLTSDGGASVIGYLIAGNTLRKARSHGRIVNDEWLVVTLHNLVDLASSALRATRLTAALQQERDRLEARVDARTAELAAVNERLIVELRERQAAERARSELQDEVIRAQTQRLAELSAPVLPVAEQILVMPLIGTIDAARGAQIQDAALTAAASHRASVLILDVTGVHAIDADCARTLHGIASGVRLLGAHTVLTGIRPEVARVLVGLDVPLGSLITESTLRSGFARALALRGR